MTITTSNNTLQECNDNLNYGFDDEDFDDVSAVLYGFRVRTESANYTEEIDALRDVFGLDVRADTVPVFTNPWINVYNNTGQYTRFYFPGKRYIGQLCSFSKLF